MRQGDEKGERDAETEDSLFQLRSWKCPMDNKTLLLLCLHFRYKQHFSKEAWPLIFHNSHTGFVL